VHGRLVELDERGRRHRRMPELRSRLEEWGERGQPHGHLAEVHDGLAELGKRRRSHRCLTEPSGRGRPPSRLAELGLEEWKDHTPAEEDDCMAVWRSQV